MKSIRIGLVTCLHGGRSPARARLGRLVLTHNAAIRVPGVEFVRVAVYSRDDALIAPALTVPGWKYVQHPNRPLSDKWGAGAKALRNLNIDGMTIFGSDDFLNETIMQEIADALRRGAQYIMPKSLYFYCAESKQAMYCEVVGRVGGGRTLSRSILERLHWQPWELGYQKNVDGCMDRRLIEIGHKHPDYTIDDIRSSGALLLGVKTDENMHAYDKMKRGLQGEDVDAVALLQLHVPEYADELLRWDHA